MLPFLLSERPKDESKGIPTHDQMDLQLYMINENSLNSNDSQLVNVEKDKSRICDVEKDFSKCILEKKCDLKITKQLEDLEKTFNENLKIFPFNQNILKNLIQENEKVDDLANYSKKIPANNENYSFEKLMEEILSLKRRNNEQEAMIQLLKVNNRKKKNNKDPTLIMNPNPNDELLLEREKLLDENIKLKQELQKTIENHKLEKKRMSKLNETLIKSKVNNPKKEKKEENNSIETNEAAKFRLKIRELENKIDELKVIIKEKSEKEINLRILLEKNSKNKLIEENENLKIQLTKKDYLIERIKNDMHLDNQIKLLFPKTSSFLEKMMNILLKIEENKFMNAISATLIRHLQKVQSSIYQNFLRPFLEKIKFLKPIEKYEINPTIEFMKRQIISNQEETNFLKKELKLSEEKIDFLNSQIEIFVKDKDFIFSFQKIKSEELVNELLEKSSNQVRFTILSCKQEIISKGLEYGAFEMLQKYIEILHKYKFVDSKMLLKPNEKKKEEENKDEQPRQHKASLVKNLIKTQKK